jgi:hypothetical protein
MGLLADRRMALFETVGPELAGGVGGRGFAPAGRRTGFAAAARRPDLAPGAFFLRGHHLITKGITIAADTSVAIRATRESFGGVTAVKLATADLRRP